MDTGAPWYDVYETKDAKHVAIGAIEAKFFAELASRLGLKDLPPQHERARWPEMRRILENKMKEKTQDEWCRVFEGSDACFAPVLSFSEARAHPHNRAREAFVELAGRGRSRRRRRATRAPRLRCAARLPSAARAASPPCATGASAATEVNRLRSRGLAFKEE